VNDVDVYPNSAPSDWVYVDMPEGPRSHIWPGAGPFRKIQVQNKRMFIIGISCNLIFIADGTRLSNGPICLDLPQTPTGYTGVRPDELDCSAYLQRVKGFGDGWLCRVDVNNNLYLQTNNLHQQQV
jgi:hypothetical protein